MTQMNPRQFVVNCNPDPNDCHPDDVRGCVRERRAYEIGIPPSRFSAENACIARAFFHEVYHLIDPEEKDEKKILKIAAKCFRGCKEDERLRR